MFINFTDDNADIFTASLLILYCSFSSLILSFAMISFYVVSKRIFPKRKELSDAGIVFITKKEDGFPVHLL